MHYKKKVVHPVGTKVPAAERGKGRETAIPGILPPILVIIRKFVITPGGSAGQVVIVIREIREGGAVAPGDGILLDPFKDVGVIEGDGVNGGGDTGGGRVH